MAAVRIGLVLSGGGLRGASHVGILQRLAAYRIPIDVVVGSSAGAVIAAYYAAVGLTLDQFLADARAFRGRHLLAHSLNLRLGLRFNRLLHGACGVIPVRLEQLEHATFDRLHHGVRGLGIVCHDVRTGRPQYFATGCDRGVRLCDVVRASASIAGAVPGRAGSVRRGAPSAERWRRDRLPADVVRTPAAAVCHPSDRVGLPLARLSPGD